MANNYFKKANENRLKKAKLRHLIAQLITEDEVNRADYLDRVYNLIQNRPGLTAKQYANILAEEEGERESITHSIDMMGYMSFACRAGRKKYRSSERVCVKPSIRDLSRERKLITRNFIEVDEDGNPIGKFSTQESRYVYNIDD